MTWLRRAVLAFLGAKLANLVVNLFTFPVLRVAARRPDQRISLLVPVRDENHRLGATVPGLLGQGAAEVVFLDDGSTDGTGDHLRAAVRPFASARVVTGVSRPDGWAGKTWAMQQLAETARGDVLVFCDADVFLAPGAVDSTLAEMRRQGADVFSIFPRQRTGSVGEHLLVPLIDDVLLCGLPFPLLHAPAPAAATANGSLMAFDRTAFDALGGFTSVRADTVEDVAMARRTRRLGLRLGLALGGELVQTRMYDRWGGLVAGFGRGLRPVAGGSRALLVVGVAWHLAVYTLPAVLVVGRPRRWMLPLLLGAVERTLVEAKTGRRRWWQALTMPASPIAAVPITVQALRARQTWKGRTYP